MKNTISRAGKKEPSNLVMAAHLHLADFDALDRDRTLFILPVSSLEVHGWHLPNDTDMTTARILAEETGRLFARGNRDWTVVLLPLLNIGTDELPLPGSIEFSRKTVYRALREYGRSLQRYGFKNLVITNGHGGLKHNLALDDACRTCNRKYGMRMTSPAILAFQDFIFGKKFPQIEKEMRRKLSEEEKTGLIDIEHAGGWETSVLLAVDRKHVSADYRKYRSSRIRLADGVIRRARTVEKIIRKIPVLRGTLAALGLPLEEGIRILRTAGKMYDQKKERFTYSGDPGVAKTDIGAAWISALPKEILALIERVYITGEVGPSKIVSNYSTILFLRRDFMAALCWAGVILLACAAAFISLRFGVISL